MTMCQYLLYIPFAFRYVLSLSNLPDMCTGVVKDALRDCILETDSQIMGRDQKNVCGVFINIQHFNFLVHVLYAFIEHTSRVYIPLVVVVMVCKLKECFSLLTLLL